MKKNKMMGAIMGAFVFGAVGLLAAEPTPDYTSMPVLTKATGTGCGPCGSWGWTQMEDAITTHGATTLIMGAYDSYYNYNAGGETALHNSYSMIWEKNVSVRWFPDFSVMSTAASSPFTAEIEAHKAKTQNVGMNFVAWVEGSNVKVARYIQSKTVLSGVYSVSTILLEDGVKHVQNSQVGSVPHHMVFRAMPNLKQRGDTLAAKATSGQLYVDTVTIAIRSGEVPAWNKNNFKIGLVLWNGNTMLNAYSRPISETYKTFGSTSSAVGSSASSSSAMQSSASLSSAVQSSVAQSSVQNISSSTLVSSSSQGGKVDCSQILSWASGSTYNGGDQAKYLGIAYKANWWTKDQPDLNSGVEGSGKSWTVLGECLSATSTLKSKIISLETLGLIRIENAYSVDLFTSLGQKVGGVARMGDFQFQVDLKKMPKGSYYLRVSTGLGVESKAFTVY